MSVILEREENLTAVTVEPYTGVDGQGVPSYGTAVTVNARVVRKDSMGVQADGSEVKTQLTLWIPPGQDATPGEQDRVTYDGATFIGVEENEVRRVDQTLDHTRLKCRKE